MATKASNEWTDDELRAAVVAYLAMLNDEIAGRPLNKASYRDQLRSGPLSRRTASSVEFRMQNISHVLQNMGRRRIDGYVPAANVGARIENKIARIIREFSDSETDNELPDTSIRLTAEEGERIWILQRRAERDPPLSREAKRLNRERFGVLTCEACGFKHSDDAMLDAHHPMPLAAGSRITHARYLEILCPTCHRRAHRNKDRLLPFTIEELREWVTSGRN